jgi:hypothetical protein
MSKRPDRDPIQIRLTPTQKEHYGRQTGLSLPSSLSLPLAQLKRLSSVAAEAGSRIPAHLALRRQAAARARAVRRTGRRPVRRRGRPHPGQKEQIGRATGNVFASLRIVPDDVPVTYRETWDDATPVRVGRTIVIKPAGKPTKRRTPTWSWSCPRATAPGGASSARGATRRRA